MMLREIFPRRLGVSSPGSPILVVVLTMIVCAGTAGAAFAGDESAQHELAGLEREIGSDLPRRLKQLVAERWGFSTVTRASRS